MVVQTRSQSLRSISLPQVDQDTAEPARVLKVHRVPSSTGSDATTNSTIPSSDHDHQPPTYIINLGLPPEQRYIQLAKDFAPQMAETATLFDDILLNIHPRFPIRSFKTLSRSLLKRLYSKEETEELQGISAAAGVDMFLLVALNTFLDLFMGCTSGGVRVKGAKDQEPRMLHFRTLDWGMDSLRKMLVKLDFVREDAGDIIATSITYAGFIGVLTGVRRGLSLSLNFRPKHHVHSPFSHLRFYGHQLLVLLGLRPSISSILRQQLLLFPTSESPHSPEQKSPARDRQSGDLAFFSSKLPATPSTACYIVCSDGNKTLAIEKDHVSAIVRSASEFIVATNHDQDDEGTANIEEDARHMASNTGMQSLVEESVSRKRCVVDLWRRDARVSEREAEKTGRVNGGMDKTRKATEEGYAGMSKACVSQEQVVDWLGTYPVTNECTHFGVLMDPMLGEIVWLRRRLEAFEGIEDDDCDGSD